MTMWNWNPDDGALDEADDWIDELASAWRYGVTGWEAARPEPFALALAQEQPELRPRTVDEQWAEIDEPDDFAGRLVADVGMADDDYAIVVDGGRDFAPEELAMHLVAP